MVKGYFWGPPGLHPWTFVVFIYISDLPDILNNDTICPISADDTKMYCKVNSINDGRVLQTDIDNLHWVGDGASNYILSNPHWTSQYHID